MIWSLKKQKKNKTKLKASILTKKQAKEQTNKSCVSLLGIIHLTVILRSLINLIHIGSCANQLENQMVCALSRCLGLLQE